jgi:betaine-aldehyde dehydrogenase
MEQLKAPPEEICLTPRDALYINGAWVTPVKGGTFPVVNPATGEVFHNAPLATAEDIDLAVKAARQAFDNDEEGSWRRTTGKQRAVYLRAIANKILELKLPLARLESLDCGKPLKESTNDMGDCATYFEYYAGLAEKLDNEQETPVEVPDPDFTTVVRKEPVGVVAAITPWNYPLLMATQKVAPALAAGCTVILKPSELSPLTALELAAIAHGVGLPPGVFNVITGDGPNTGAPLSQHPGVDKVSFTGSVPTGSRIMATAAADIKKVSLELGGKSPMIVFDDVDIDTACEWIMFGIFWNQGQVCSATSRVLLQETIAERVIGRLKEAVGVINVGDPLTTHDPAMGPIISQAQYEKIINYIRDAKEGGATLVTGGERPEGLERGYFLKPTIFANVDKSSRIWREEIFGPVLSIRTFKDEREAVEEANDTTYGLGAAVLSSDPQRCARVARAFRAGVVWVNCSQPAFVQAPWGGMKRSGLGRELGPWGLDAFLELKQICSYKGKHWGWYY